jgi:hypothetical protein
MTSVTDSENGFIERAYRQRTYKSAFIYNKGYNGKRTCILRNISETGALLQIEHIAGLPSHFTVGVELDAFEVPAKWIWREEERVGVQFEGPLEPIESKRTQVLYLSDDPRLMEDEYQDQMLFRGPSAREVGERNSASSIRKRRSPGFGKR